MMIPQTQGHPLGLLTGALTSDDSYAQPHVFLCSSFDPGRPEPNRLGGGGVLVGKSLSSVKVTCSPKRT